MESMVQAVVAAHPQARGSVPDISSLRHAARLLHESDAYISGTLLDAYSPSIIKMS